MIIRPVANNAELHQILALQCANHFLNVSKSKQAKEGFVTVKHSLEQLQKMNALAPQIIAVKDAKLLGYALAMTPACKDMVPVLQPMFSMFENLRYDQIPLTDLNYYVMGQICVAQEARGLGVVQALYHGHHNTFAAIYELCLTEVSVRNPRSLNAHQKVGFKKMHTYKDASDTWHILSWDWNKN